MHGDLCKHLGIDLSTDHPDPDILVSTFNIVPDWKVYKHNASRERGISPVSFIFRD